MTTRKRPIPAILPNNLRPGFPLRTTLLLSLALLAAPALYAQAPVVTPAGDPSVRDDSIYALAVKPAEHADEDYVYLLDDGIVTVEADGRSRTTYRQVIQILNREAAENWGELSFGYSPDRERLTVNWVRVLSLDGHVLSDHPAHEQESRSSVAETAPVYTDRMVKRLSLGGVAPGTIVDYSYTTEVLSPLVPGDFLSNWRVTTGRLTRRSRLIFDAPASVTPAMRVMNWHWASPVTVHGGRRVWTWAASDVPKLEGEPFAAEPNSLEVTMVMGLPRSWQDVARDFDRMAHGRFALDTALESRLSQAVAGARTLEDSLRAAHRWVAQDFRYVSLSLGLGGYQPRLPAEVLSTRYGDCKDKAVLFISLARRMGVRAWPVLLSSDASADSTMPTFRQFDHMIAAVELPGRPGYLFLDLTADLTPYGELPLSEQGGFAVVIKDGGRAERVVLPVAPVSANRSAIALVGEVDTSGTFSGRLTREATGARQYSLREAFAEATSPSDRERFLRTAAGSIFDNAVGDSLVAFDGRDLRAPARITMALRNGRAVRSSGGLELLHVPIDNFASTGVANELAARGPRRFPIDVPSVAGVSELDMEFRVTLPEGWQARLPANVSAASAFGTFRAEYSQQGRVLSVKRYLAGARGTQPPEKIGELIDWLRAMSRDDVSFIVLEHSAH